MELNLNIVFSRTLHREMVILYQQMLCSLVVSYLRTTKHAVWEYQIIGVIRLVAHFIVHHYIAGNRSQFKYFCKRLYAHTRTHNHTHAGKHLIMYSHIYTVTDTITPADNHILSHTSM